MGSSTVKLGGNTSPSQGQEGRAREASSRVADLVLVLTVKPREPGFLYRCQHSFMAPHWLVGSSLSPLAEDRAAPTCSQTL